VSRNRARPCRRTESATTKVQFVALEAGDLGVPPPEATDAAARRREEGLPGVGGGHEVDEEGGEMGRARAAGPGLGHLDR